LCRRHAIACQESDLTLTNVYCAAEAFCTGTMGEIAPVVEVDGRKIGSGQPGPITNRLSSLYSELTASEGVRVV
jgi:branched-chain amino acid aminotransferase